jgi:hypothetical protein
MSRLSAAFESVVERLASVAPEEQEAVLSGAYDELPAIYINIGFDPRDALGVAFDTVVAMEEQLGVRITKAEARACRDSGARYWWRAPD